MRPVPRIKVPAVFSATPGPISPTEMDHWTNVKQSRSSVQSLLRHVY